MGLQLNSNEIAEILPHRYPFALVDRITDGESGVWAKGIKCVSVGEPFFCGHFPQKHVMPGVLILEALAQVGAVAILSLPENRGKIALFGGVKNARFKRQVIPGDVLELECTLTKRRGPVGIGACTATVNGETACTAELIFAIQLRPLPFRTHSGEKRLFRHAEQQRQIAAAVVHLRIDVRHIPSNAPAKHPLSSPKCTKFENFAAKNWRRQVLSI